eukprot:755184-Hanusia_phi.AAC.1
MPKRPEFLRPAPRKGSFSQVGKRLRCDVICLLIDDNFSRPLLDSLFSRHPNMLGHHHPGAASQLKP